MKKIYLILLLFLFSGAISLNSDTVRFKEPTKIESKKIQFIEEKTKLSDLDNLINAIIYVESRGNDSAIGDCHIKGGEAVGALQIRPIMVKEVNRILHIQKKNKKFNLKDRFNREKSIEMFLIWKNYHHSKSNIETISRCWNGGSRGYLNPKTKKYWTKVQHQLKK